MRSASSPFLLAGLLGASILLAGCGGPTKAGREARSAASQRMAAFSAGATFQQARQELIAGRFDRALDSAERAIAAQPDMPEYRILKGRVLLESDKLELAEEAFVAAVTASERSIEAIESAVAEREERDGEPVSDRDLERIDLQKRSVRRVEAEAWYYLGIVRQRWNRLEQAASDYRTAHDLDPQPVAYLIAAAEMLLDLDRPTEVEQLIDPVLDRYQGDVSLVVLLARAAMLRDEPRLAAERYAEARILRPNDQLLAEEFIRAAFESEMYQACLDAIRTHAASYAEPRADLLRIEARCHTMLARPELADAVYRELVRTVPGDVEAWVEYGTVAWELGEFGRVNLCGTRLQRLAPDRWEGALFRGLAAESDGDLDLALTEFTRAASLAGDAAMPHLLLARVLEARGEVEAAATAWRAAIAADPDDAVARALAMGRLTAAGG